MKLVWLDTETTGVDIEYARIVQLAILDTNGDALFESLLKPDIPIPPEVSAIHGIYAADVEDAPTFMRHAALIQGLLTDGDPVLAGYNSRRFDVPILDAELRRAGQPGLDLVHLREVDVLLAWRALEPRTLTGAAMRYLGEEYLGGHDSFTDANVTRMVADALVADAGIVMAELVRLSKPEDEVDRFGRFRRREDGVIEFAFGKFDGRPATSERGYLRWMLDTNFAEETKVWCRRLLSGRGEAS